MKLLHTSDLQLDAPFTFLGVLGQDHREQLRETFAAILALAEREDYQMLLIAGDLFDSNRPMQRTIDQVVRGLGGLSIPVCILPGNHDPYNKKSIYRKMNFPANVTIFGDAVQRMSFPKLDLTVYANAILRMDSYESPMENIKATGDSRWHVAMAHGNLVTGVVKDPKRPISEQEIAESGMDYVALGDWHGYADYSQGDVRAAYSGSPEPLAFDQTSSGYIASVTLVDHSVKVEKIAVGRIRAHQLEVDVSGKTQAEITDIILEQVQPEMMLEIVLKGLHEVGTIIDPLHIQETIATHVYAARVRDQSHVQLEDLSAADYPEEHVIGKFIHSMHARIRLAQDDVERSRAEHALQIGVALLEGKDVI